MAKKDVSDRERTLRDGRRIHAVVEGNVGDISGNDNGSNGEGENERATEEKITTRPMGGPQQTDNIATVFSDCKKCHGRNVTRGKELAIHWCDVNTYLKFGNPLSVSIFNSTAWKKGGRLCTKLLRGGLTNTFFKFYDETNDIKEAGKKTVEYFDEVYERPRWKKCLR